ncbi:MAG: quinoprotein relay system zinc metallohydrolase 2 [Burkholderiaceae bacterium]
MIALWPVAVPHEAAAVDAATELTMRQIAPGVYVHQGRQEDVSPANHGDVANVGFIVGASCVAVIDTGTTLHAGEALRAAVRRATKVPVCYVINTHVHPDHIFGNAAFADDAPQYVGHARLPAAMAARGANQLHALLRELGDAAAGSTLVAPTLLVDPDRTLDLGGREIRLHAWRTAHTDNDLSVYDVQTDTWWLSDLLFVGHIPVVDGNLRGWIAVLETLARMSPPAHVVPGHGPIDAPWTASIATERAYLDWLVHGVRGALRDGRTMQETVDTLGVDPNSAWLLVDTFHRRNVTAAYAEYEWED